MDMNEIKTGAIKMAGKVHNMIGFITPMAANIYFDMLDFTGNLARHSSSIVKLFE